MAFGPDDIIAAARSRCGLEDFGDDWFLGPLQAWCADLSAPHLSDRGRKFLTNLAVNDVVRRLQIVDCLKQDPEIEKTELPPMLYVTGLERSGTTLLHNLLGLHADARFLSRWELMAPVPPPEAASFGEDGRKAKVQSSVDALKGSALESMHWVNASDPEECVWGFMDCTGLLGQAPGFVMPHWFAWLDTHDQTPSFLNYRKVMQILTYKNPVPPGGFLVLKAPQVSRFLFDFAAAFPEAKFVFTHRDPYRVITSTCTLVDIVNKPFLEDPSFLEALERSSQNMLARAKERLLDIRRFSDAQPSRAKHIGYAELVDAPYAAIAPILNGYELQSDADLESKIEEFLEAQKKGRRAQPRKEISDFGYAQDAVLADEVIAHYMQHFGVAREETRKTGSS